MNNIDAVLDMLDWNSSPEKQKEGIRLACEVDCYKAFFQPNGPRHHKNVWDNCAKVIAQHSDSELLPYIIDMLMWIQDLNWPGAITILKRLQAFLDVTLLALIINKLVVALRALDDTVWMCNIAELLCNQSLKKQLSHESIQVLLSANLEA